VLVVIGVAAIVEGRGVADVEPDRLLVVGGGLHDVALVAPGEAAVAVGQRVLRVELERLVIVG
jgi:hypothetical protein